MNIPYKNIFSLHLTKLLTYTIIEVYETYRHNYQ